MFMKSKDPPSSLAKNLALPQTTLAVSNDFPGWRIWRRGLGRFLQIQRFTAAINSINLVKRLPRLHPDKERAWKTATSECVPLLQNLILTQWNCNDLECEKFSAAAFHIFSSVTEIWWPCHLKAVSCCIKHQGFSSDDSDFKAASSY